VDTREWFAVWFKAEDCHHAGLPCLRLPHGERCIQASIRYASQLSNLSIESQMAAFLKENKISFKQDRENTLSFSTCPAAPIPLPSETAEKPRSVRPDFFLDEISTLLGCYILIGNDEFAHRRYRYVPLLTVNCYRCDFARTLNIAAHLSLNYDGTDEEIPLIYIRGIVIA
jgi:hypothetical protein